MTAPSTLHRVHLRSYPRDQAAHAHAFHQLVVPLAGRLELEVAGRGGDAEGLSCVLVAAGERHAFAADGSNRFLVLDFDEALASAAEARDAVDRAARSPFFAAPPGMARLASLLADDAARGPAPDEVQRAWTTLLVRAAAGALAVPVRAASRPESVERALALLEARASLNLRIAEVARAAGVAVGHLHALFRRHVGRTPRQVLLAHRLELARELLSRTDLPIADVALRCGFADQPTLTRAMRRETGRTPGDVRRGRAETRSS